MCQGRILYVILPYFNFCNFKRRRQLFIEFVGRISRDPCVRIVVVEIGKSLPNLPVHSHHRIPHAHTIWMKENLINFAVERLPDTWESMAWIDADITFMNERWSRDTLKELRSSDVVQLFQSAVNLGPDGETIRVDTGFMYAYKSGRQYSKTNKYGHWHPGYAWACTNQAYHHMGRLIDWAILGSGDRHMAMALIGKVQDSYPGGVQPAYKAILELFQQKCAGMRVSHINGTIMHHWHGSLQNRKYVERWQILVDNKFDPLVDIGRSNEGLIRLTPAGMRFEPLITEYFVGRSEDGLKN